MTKDRPSLRVIVADDQILVRQGICALLGFGTDIAIAGQAANGQEAVALAQATRPDVVLMDVRMPIMDGIEATRALRRSLPETAVIILTTFDDDHYLAEAVRAGACGFLLKDGDADDLARAIRAAASGGSVIAPQTLARLLPRLASEPQADPTAVELVAHLTAREREVLALIARGFTNQAIANALVVGEATVRTHVSHVFAKLGVRTRTEAVILAFAGGLVSSDLHVLGSRADPSSARV